jgi:hypothetical protein
MQPESGDMDRDRVQFLQEALAANPDDTFARYALARHDGFLPRESRWHKTKATTMPKASSSGRSNHSID